MSKSLSKSVVILVDSKTRDLPVAALIGHHLNQLDIQCHLEPLEAYQAVLEAYRPRMILFNHLTASHLAAYSQRLNKIGVLTGVLPNEGIMYDEDDLKFNSGKYHSQAHIDYYFCWNGVHQKALGEFMDKDKTHVEVVGVPRFDFYFKPWSSLYCPVKTTPRDKPKILFCTNFQTARFWELPREEGDKFFAAWKDRIPLYRNYWRSIEAHFKGRQRVLAFLDAIAAAGKYNLILRAHPREDITPYQNWVNNLPTSQRADVTLDHESNITSLILDCDLEISCETCTTAMESWIAGKPTIELALERDPLWFYEEHARGNPHCDKSNELVPLIEQELNRPMQGQLTSVRQAHLQKWCNAPDGNSCQKIAGIIARSLATQPDPDWSLLTLSDARRALKLRLTQSIGQAYHYDPFMRLKKRLRSKKYAIKNYAYQKSIRPADAKAICVQIEQLPGCPTTIKP